MSVVQPFPRPHSGRTLRIVEEFDRDVYWCHMHANLARAPGRACFTPSLIDDILSYQRHLGERMRQGDRHGLAHVVLASDHDVFNLGGDLDLFCRLIRERDRDGLLDYARQCVRGVHAFHAGLGAGVHSIALVQGNALGGGFEAALSCHTIVAEAGALMGLPEVLFDLFPGMGAYSFLCKRIAPRQAERLMLEGDLYTAEELHAMGVVDVLVPRGEGRQAVEDVIRANRRIPHARAAMHQVRELAQGVSLEEMMRITEIWVDTAMQLGDKSLRTMDRLVRAQSRRGIEAA
ncbi:MULTISPECIES: crotonase/enoyl-CoA hydratase family protein [Lysobacter]|jgi:DSF synthase|uniref:crotonase/enoyl-CoA hydratase family protein n=1 Tax=Lysobacter TaxID=68 RepID=UPI001EED91CC|nr:MULTISPECIES: crotonase/enoyl-CoA hydratase family protein [Lysobacter]UJB21625.1 crotonase/enoyl-CoA hydratase family protein [Lysobacter capsici]UJQ29258.1 crotonase/enoyl-CoA hydratase family protein [Lysobacter gummosus]